eukprot:5636818-Pyramimonas_sp.AAC.1
MGSPHDVMPSRCRPSSVVWCGGGGACVWCLRPAPRDCGVVLWLLGGTGGLQPCSASGLGFQEKSGGAGAEG